MTTYENKPWLKHYEQDVPRQMEYEDICIPQFFDRTVAAYPDRIALIFQGYKMS